MTAPLWVVVPAYNEAARIGATLAALAAQTDTDFTLLVVDNGSTDAHRRASPARSAAPFPMQVLVEPEKGVGCAVDTGFRHAIAAGAAMLARTDADCLPRPGWVAAARAALAGGAGLVVRADRRPPRRARPGSGGRSSALLVAARGRVRPAAPGPPRRRLPGALPDARGQQHGDHRGAVRGVRRHAAAAVAHRPRLPQPGAPHHRRDRAQPAHGGGELDPPARARTASLGTARWYLDRGSGALDRGPALMLTELIDGLRADDDRPACWRRRCDAAGELGRLAGGYAVALHEQRTGRGRHGRPGGAARARARWRPCWPRTTWACGSPCWTRPPGRTCCWPGWRWPRPRARAGRRRRAGGGRLGRPRSPAAPISRCPTSARWRRCGPSGAGCPVRAPVLRAGQRHDPGPVRRRRRRGHRVHLGHDQPAARRRAHPGSHCPRACGPCTTWSGPCRACRCWAARSSCWSRRWRPARRWPCRPGRGSGAADPAGSPRRPPT